MIINKIYGIVKNMPKTNLRARLWKISTKPKVKTLIINLIILAVTLLFFLFILEASLRFTNTCSVSPDKSGNLFTILQKSDNPNFIYELKPSSEGYLNGQFIEINSHGMKSPEITMEKQENTYRIAFLGDSITFGWAIPFSDSFPEQLKNKLQQSSEKDIEILNFAVPGYVGIQNYETLRSKVLKYDPDLVIMGHFLNDPDSIWQVYETSTNIPTPIKIFLNENSCTYNWAKTRRNIILNRAGVITNSPYEKLYIESSETWQNHKQLFDNMATFSKDNNVQILVVILPNWHNLNDEYEFIKIHQQLNKTITDAGLLSLDMFQELNGMNAELLRIEHVHPNIVGHKLIADSIYKKLEEENILP
jgi:lysophospholipase L1-like esterase